MSSGFDYTAHEGSLDGPAVGTYLHDGADGPEAGAVIRLEGLIGPWRVTAGPQGAGRQFAVERVEDDLVSFPGD